MNPAGLDFYDRLVDGLLEAGIAPFATLYHWDLPLALHDRGGWLNPDIADWFADYAEVVWRRLGDRVAHWMTLNEPWVVVDGGLPARRPRARDIGSRGGAAWRPTTCCAPTAGGAGLPRAAAPSAPRAGAASASW